MNDFQKKVLEHPAYWVEGINSSLYNAIVEYMDDHKLNRTQLAAHLNLSQGRISQILNDGDINFSIEKLVEICLKIGKFPKLEFIDKEEFSKNPKKKSEEVEYVDE